MPRRVLTDNEARLLAIRQGISGRAWDEARWVDGRNVIVSGPNGDMLADMAIVMPATANRSTPDGGKNGWVGAEGVEMPWEEVAFRLSGGGKLFGVATDRQRPYRDPPAGWERGS